MGGGGVGSPTFRACFSLPSQLLSLCPLLGDFSWNFGGV